MSFLGGLEKLPLQAHNVIPLGKFLVVLQKSKQDVLAFDEELSSNFLPIARLYRLVLDTSNLFSKPRLEAPGLHVFQKQNWLD